VAEAARQRRSKGGQPVAIAMVTAMAVMATAAVEAMAKAMAAMATTTAAVAAMVTAIVAMGTATAAVVSMATAMAATMAATMTVVAGAKTTAVTVMPGDTDNNQLKGAAEEMTAAATVGGRGRRHARSGDGLQWGRDDGGKRCRRQLSGNDGCNGGRPRRRTTTATADDDGGGRRRRRMTTARKIGRQTMTEKDESGRQEAAETAEWR
jgi:hypothetical protein